MTTKSIQDRTCEQGCNGCDECIDDDCDDYEDDEDDEDDEECPHCHGEGRDPMNDYLLPCPLCQGEQLP